MVKKCNTKLLCWIWLSEPWAITKKNYYQLGIFQFHVSWWTYNKIGHSIVQIPLGLLSYPYFHTAIERFSFPEPTSKSITCTNYKVVCTCAFILKTNALRYYLIQQLFFCYDCRYLLCSINMRGPASYIKTLLVFWEFADSHTCCNTGKK